VIKALEGKCFNSSIGLTAVLTFKPLRIMAKEYARFNSSIGLTAVLTARREKACSVASCFNSSIGLTAVLTGQGQCERGWEAAVSIPQSD